MENGCMNEYTCKSTTRCSRITTRWVRDSITQMKMIMVVTKIDAKAFTMMEMIEMDACLRIPPTDTFQRLGFGEISWSGDWSTLSSILMAWG